MSILFIEMIFRIYFHLLNLSVLAFELLPSCCVNLLTTLVPFNLKVLNVA